tara:strand:- start:464 stop:673 length:210 start_codon:yes stop_codon:yes gene_type:complete
MSKSLCRIIVEYENETIFMLKNYLGQEELLNLVKDIGSSVQSSVSDWNQIRSLRERVAELEEELNNANE